MKKLMIYVTLILMLCSFTIAATPTIPSVVTPSNNAVLFNTPTLTCSGSTDSDSHPINITFAELYQINESAGETWIESSPGTSSNHIGTGYGDPSYSQSDQTYNAYMRKDVIFLTSTWRLQLNTSVGSGCSPDQNAILTVDGDQIFISSGTSDYPTQNKSLDVSAYNDGESHEIKFLMDGESCGEKEWFRYWWDANQTIELSTSINTSYEWLSLNIGTQGLWTCKACDNSSICSNYTDGRALTLMNFTSCSSGNVALHTTIKNELNFSESLISDLSGELTLDTQYDTFGFTINEEGANNYKFCLTPNNIPINLSGFISYLPENINYTFPREYAFNNDEIIGNSEQDITLYSLNDEDGELILITLKDAFGNLIQGATITIQKYIGNAWISIYDLTTDALGRSQGDFILNSAYYNHVITVDDTIAYGTLNTSVNRMNMYAEDVANGLTFSINLYGLTLDKLWQNTLGVVHSLSFTNTTNSTGYFSFEFIDNSGQPWEACMEVIDNDLQIIDGCSCSDLTVNTQSAILICNLNATSTTTYKANAYIKSEETFFNVESLLAKLKVIEQIDWGTTGYFIALMITTLTFFIFINSPTVSIIIGTATMITLSLLGLILPSIGLTILFMHGVIAFMIGKISSEGKFNG